MKTRVQRINEAIFYLFINKGESARQIQKQLLTYDIELSLVEILTIISSFNYKPIKDRKKSKTQTLKSEFKDILEPLIRTASTYGISNKKIVEYLNYYNYPYPNSKNKEFTVCKLDSLLADYQFNYKRKRKKLSKTDEEIFNLINTSLDHEELINLENWKRSNV